MPGLAILSKAQVSLKKQGHIIPPTVCYASEKTEKSFVPPPVEFLQKSGNEKKSDFIVTYDRVPDEKARAAFEYAVSIWEQIIESSVPIRVSASWRSKETNILASAGPSDYFSDFEYAPHPGRFYPIALVEKITGREISGTSIPDIEVTVNKDIKWYYGTDGATPDQLYDFVTVALHEIGHGLGFTGFFYVTSNKGLYGNNAVGEASAFDVMVVDKTGKNLTDTSFYALASVDLYNAFVSQALYSESPSAKLATQGSKIRLYAPATWNDGSSIYHLNDETYTHGNDNSLMTHAIGKGEANHDPGPVTRGILADIGWKIMKLDLKKPADIETVQLVEFQLSVKSDFAIDPSKLFVYISTDSFKTYRDSVLFLQDTKPDQYKATYLPDSNAKRIDYFISSTDVMNRVFRLPAEAPEAFYSLYIGSDTKKPEITHNPFPFFILNGDDLSISALVSDNFGLDSVYVEFSVNNVAKPAFGLSAENGNNYTGIFDIQQNQLNDGDIFKYRIFARDASSSGNLAVSPSSGVFSFKIDKIFNPIGGYFNNFNNPTTDFVSDDFGIYTAENFLNASIHSPHPYPSPGKNYESFDFVTMLKYPIILKEDGKMNFDEIVLVEPGEVLSNFGDDDFWDYVIVEGSKDNGKTWLPLADGYDSRQNTTWETNYKKNIGSDGISNTKAIPDWFSNHEINLLANGNFSANDTILIRFRLYSDPYAHGWGWTIDNLKIQDPVASSATALVADNILIYPNPATEKLHINVGLQKTVKNLNVELYNSFGQKIETIFLNEISARFETSFDVTYLAKGVYFVKISAGDEPAVVKKFLRN